MTRRVAAVFFHILFIALAFFPHPLFSAQLGNPEGPAIHDIFRVTYIDVGQGDAILLRTKEKTILIDAGSDLNSAAQDFILPYLEKEDIKRLDTCIITHPHRDHFGGFLQLVQSIPIGEFLIAAKTMNPPPTDPETNRVDPVLYQELIKKITEKQIPLKTVTMTDTFNWGSQVHVDILHTDDIQAQKNPHRAPINPNDQSLVFKVSAGKLSYLFTGDAEAASEQKMLRTVSRKLKATVLKSGHHGSRTASSLEFLKKVNPDYVAISVGINNSYRHPHQEVLQRYASMSVKLFRTDHDGTIESSTDGKTIQFVCAQTPVRLTHRLANLAELEVLDDPQVISMRYDSILGLAFHSVSQHLAKGDTNPVLEALQSEASGRAPELKKRIQQTLRFKDLHGELSGSEKNLLHSLP